MFLFARFGDGPRPPKMPRCDNRGGFRGWGLAPAALATEAEDTEATAALADSREEEGTEAAQGEAPEERAVATEATGLWRGAGGSDGSSVRSFPFDKSAFLSPSPLLLLPVLFLSTSAAL